MFTHSRSRRIVDAGVKIIVTGRPDIIAVTEY